MASFLQGIRLKVEIKIELHHVMEALDEYAEKFHRRMGPLIRQQMKLLITDVIKGTAPFGSRGFRNESFAFQRKLGENAVAHDIGKVFGSIEYLAAHNTNLGPALTSALQQNNMEVLGHKNSLPELMLKAKVIDEIGMERGDKIIDAPAKAILDQFRVEGRVKRRLPYMIWVKRTSALKRFIRDEWKLVGKLKGGWGAGARAFKVHLPAWIARHDSGEVVNLTDRKENPYALARNTVSYAASNNVDARTTLYALQDRRAALEHQLKALAEGKIKI